MSSAKQDFIRQFAPHQGLVRSLCAAYFSQREDQQDAFQDVLLQLWKAYPSFRGESAFVTWVYRIALRTLVNQAQRSRRRPTCPYRSEYERSEASFEEAEVLYFALDQLSSSDKALVLLHLEGYRYQEIAELLELSATNVSTRFSRIKQKLRKIIMKESSWS